MKALKKTPVRSVRLIHICWALLMVEDESNESNQPKPSSACSARTGVATGRLEDACKDWAQNQVMEEKFVVEGIGYGCQRI